MHRFGMPRGSEPWLPPSQSGTAVGGCRCHALPCCSQGRAAPSTPCTPPGMDPPAPAACFLFLPVGICTEFHILPQTRARRRGGGGGRIEDQTQRVAEPLCLYIRRYIYTGWKPTTTNCSLALGCWFCPRRGHLPWAKALLCSLSLMSRRMYSVFSVLFVSFCFNYYYYF